MAVVGAVFAVLAVEGGAGVVLLSYRDVAVVALLC